MSPPLLGVELAFSTGMWFSRRVWGSQCFFTKSQSMQEIWAPESMRAWTSTSFRECKGTAGFIGMWIDFLERDASSTFETVTGRGGTHID